MLQGCCRPIQNRVLEQSSEAYKETIRNCSAVTCQGYLSPFCLMFVMFHYICLLPVCPQVQFGCKSGRDEAGTAQLSAFTRTLGKGIPQLPDTESHQSQNVCTTHTHTHTITDFTYFTPISVMNSAITFLLSRLKCCRK